MPSDYYDYYLSDHNMLWNVLAFENKLKYITLDQKELNREDCICAVYTTKRKKSFHFCRDRSQLSKVLTQCVATFTDSNASHVCTIRYLKEIQYRRFKQQLLSSVKEDVLCGPNDATRVVVFQMCFTSLVISDYNLHLITF